MEATPSRLRRHGFGRRSYFETLVCRRGRTPVGFALYFYTYSTFLGRPSLYLEDLFVLPEERGRGAGRALLRALAKIAVARGCGRMEWTVLDWNTPSIRFYKGLGARLHKEWVLTRLTGPALRRLSRGALCLRTGFMLSTPSLGFPLQARENGLEEGVHHACLDRSSGASSDSRGAHHRENALSLAIMRSTEARGHL